MRRSRLKILPNLVSLTRLALCPVVITLITKGKTGPALALFVVACLLDGLDGYLARHLDARTHLGEILDPICDKVFVLSFFTLLMTMGACPPWFLGLLISVTLFQGIALAALKLGRNRARSYSALPIGKWNMALQFAWILFLLVDALVLHHGPQSTVAEKLIHSLGYTALGVIQIGVFLRYFLHFRPELSLHLRSGSVLTRQHA
jgi:cardiolipin synthase